MIWPLVFSQNNKTEKKEAAPIGDFATSIAPSRNPIPNIATKIITTLKSISQQYRKHLVDILRASETYFGQSKFLRGDIMSKPDMTPLPSWREIARRASEEHDPNKALELAEQLIRALDKESRRRMDGINTERKGAA